MDRILAPHLSAGEPGLPSDQTEILGCSMGGTVATQASPLMLALYRRPQRSRQPRGETPPPQNPSAFHPHQTSLSVKDLELLGTKE